jgi:ferritin
MPDTQKYKSVSVPNNTYKMLVELSKEIFEAPLTISKTIEYLARKETKKKNGKSNS